MNKIKVMDDSLANKIAAGEVVEKCVSVVKELVENSIDANADEITIELVASGTKLIKVIDNGDGMNKEDAKLAFIRHATSKLFEEDDLWHINSLGFRGEALPSIASVSEVFLKTSNGTEGTSIHLMAGRLIKEENSDLRKGTIIEIHNLFYNTPARLKYLNSLYSELANIISFIQKIALSYPNIKFKLISDNDTIFQTDGSGKLLKVINDIYGTEVSKKVILISGSNSDYEIDGYISYPEITRSSRSHMITLVNGRVVRNTDLNKIINDAYHTFKPENRYPIVVLNIISDPSLIDVNIHPSKLDIKFSNFEDLKLLVSDLIKKSLNKTLLIPEITTINRDFIDTPNYILEEQMLDLNRVNVVTEPDSTINEKEIVKTIFKEPKIELPELYPVGLVKGTYIICQNDLGMYLIDQHAAKERINYEYYVTKFGNPNIDIIEMLIPINFEWPADEFLILKNNFDLLESLGIKAEEFGYQTLAVKAHPTWLPKGFEKQALRNILEMIIAKEKQFSVEKFMENIAIMLSCKLSIKANQNITITEMEHLINDLRNCNNPYTCPHGRPTIIFYSNYDLEKLFKRAM